MKRFLFAVAVVALFSAVGQAQDQSAAPATSSTPVITASAPVQYGSTTSTARRGLFWRLRNRNNMNYQTTAPVMTAPTTGTTPMPPVAPMPMPGVKTTSGTSMMPATVVQAGGLPAGTYTTTDGTVIQVGGSNTMDSTMPTQTSRRGLLGRLRNR